MRGKQFENCFSIFLLVVPSIVWTEANTTKYLVLYNVQCWNDQDIWKYFWPCSRRGFFCSWAPRIGRLTPLARQRPPGCNVIERRPTAGKYSFQVVNVADLSITLCKSQYIPLQVWQPFWLEKRWGQHELRADKIYKGFQIYHWENWCQMSTLATLPSVKGTFDGVLAVCVPCGLTIVEGDLFASLDLPLGEEAKAGHVGVQTVHVHVEYVQVGITAARFTGWEWFGIILTQTCGWWSG